MPQFDPVKLESFVKIRAPQIAKDIQAVAAKANNEADLVAETEKILDKFATNFDIQLDLRRERTLINGRADAVYNRFVIEYEPPRSLTKSNTHRNNKHAIEQVQNYMGGLERLDRQKKERLAGVAMDGLFFIFVRYRDDHWAIDEPLPIGPSSTEKFLRYLLALSTELALTPENLVRDFGEISNVAKLVVPALYKAISTTENKKADVLFRQWLLQFREVSGYDPEGSQLNAQELGNLYAVNEKNISLEKLFFSIHTYYAAFIKLLALQVAYYYLMPKMGSGLRGAANGTDEQLCKFLQNMERGGLFADLGIKNFLEGDFFGWYLDIWDENLYMAFQRLVGDLANYSLVTLDVDPEETRDLLKQLYQNLVPKELRHALGEYYTPDWLAERLLNQLGYQGDPKIRILDPACGSGTFLVLAIKRVHAYSDEKMLPPLQVLDQVLQNVVGFDLNPLAVISSRTNYLLALGDLLQHRSGDITIPVYLADSILTPTQGTDLFTQNAYSFSTAVGKFSVPRVLVQANYISQLADLLEECVHVNLEPSLFERRLINTFGLNQPEDNASITITIGLYNRLIELENKDINGIWARIIKNAFAPLFQSKFDLIAGNPPWVNWANLPQEYRNDMIPTWEKYSLFTQTGLKARLGGAMDDISILMVYVAMDKYLKDNGKLGFVITQTIFKSEGGGDGFRRLQLGSGDFLEVVHVDDLNTIQVFEGATNKTSVLILKKGNKTKYPVNYTHWKKITKNQSIDQSNSLVETLGMVKTSYWAAKPINKNHIRSPWLTGKARALEGLEKCIGKSDYVARMGVHFHGNGAYWLNIIQQNRNNEYIVTNLPESGRTKLDSIQTPIEEEFVYPLLRGKDVHQWTFDQSMFALIPYTKNSAPKAYPINEMKVNYPKTAAFLNYFKKFLENRSGYKQYFNPELDPYYSLYNLGLYTFANYKVVWRYITSEFTCAVIDSNIMPNGEKKVLIPETKLVLVPFENPTEAHYLCACLSSVINRYLVKSYAVNTQIATHVLNYLKVPKFDEQNSIHNKLSDLSLIAHDYSRNKNFDNFEDVADQIDETAGKLWGINKAEIKDMKENILEM